MKKFNELRERMTATINRFANWLAEDVAETPALDYMAGFAILIAIAMWSKPAWDYHPLAVGVLIAFFLFLYAVEKWISSVGLHKSRAKRWYWLKYGLICLFAALCLSGATIFTLNVPGFLFAPTTFRQPLEELLPALLGLVVMAIFGTLTVKAAQIKPDNGRPQED